MERIGFPGKAATDDEHTIVGLQLGRDPRGQIAIAARCPYGLPGVVRTTPRLEDGTPFPTLYYLTCPVAVREIGRLEATGFMDEMRDRLETDPEFTEAYARAHDHFIAQRDSLEVLDEPMSAGGMPGRVKCLHALYAHHAADHNPVGQEVAERIEPLDCPGPCVQDMGDGLERVPGHPGFKGKKRR
ncbi:MAG: DUF501 domain-containing protein [Actinomycetota bacterium]